MSEDFISASTTMNKQVMTMMTDSTITDEKLAEFVKVEVLKLLPLLPENIQSDIPAHEPVPRRRLENHLKSDDFFAVGSYPAARFKLDEVNRQGGQRYRVTGTLTMRGRSHPVTFDARVETTEPDALVARAQFSIDRQKWGVAYRGSRLTDDLVDDEIHLDLYLVAGR
jgi:hypothetical protein